MPSDEVDSEDGDHIIRELSEEEERRTGSFVVDVVEGGDQWRLVIPNSWPMSNASRVTLNFINLSLRK